jgi:hypothetical protein
MIFKQFQTILKSFVEKKIKAFLESTMSRSSHIKIIHGIVLQSELKLLRNEGRLVGFLFCFEISQTIATRPLSPTWCALGAHRVRVHGCGFITFRPPNTGVTEY